MFYLELIGLDVAFLLKIIVWVEVTIMVIRVYIDWLFSYIFMLSCGVFNSVFRKTWYLLKRKSISLVII